jgi:hypothetical protein
MLGKSPQRRARGKANWLRDGCKVASAINIVKLPRFRRVVLDLAITILS